VDHLTPANYLPYFTRLVKTFPGRQLQNLNHILSTAGSGNRKTMVQGLDKDFYTRFVMILPIYGFNILSRKQAVFI